MIDGLMTYDEACEIRANEDFDRRNNPDYKRSALMPQSGFQERVLRCNADILFIGGNRGGATAVSEIKELMEKKKAQMISEKDYANKFKNS